MIWPDAPRYGPEEPFPPYRFEGGNTPHPTRDPKGHSYGRSEDAVHVPADRWREDETYLRGVDLFHAGYLWEAHEAWEGIWKASPDPLQKEFLQGLIQLAAALIKRRDGNERGASELARRAAQRLARVAARNERYMGLDLTELPTPARPRLVLAGADPQ